MPGRCRRRRCAYWRCPRPTARPAPDSCRIPGRGARPASPPISSRAAKPPAVGTARVSIEIEIAAGRQYLGPAAARRAGRAGRHEPPVEPGEQPRDFGGAAAARPPAANGARSSRAPRGSAASPVLGVHLARRPAAAPALPAARPYRRRSAMAPAAGETLAGRGPVHGSARIERQRVGAEAEIGGQGAQQRGILRARAAGRAGESDQQLRRAARPRGFAQRRAARRGSAIPSARTETRRACAMPSPVRRLARCRNRRRARRRAPVPGSPRRAARRGADRRCAAS